MIDTLTCTYCGNDTGIVREHVIPAAFWGYRSYNDHEQWVVDGCADCNKLAGSYVCFSIPDKAKYLIKRYKSYYSKTLKIPYWTPEELSELSYRLRSGIEESMVAKVIIQRRIEHLKRVSEREETYLRPDWVEKLYRQWHKDQEKQKKELARRERDKRKRNKLLAELEGE